jgi:hypothetical protein
MPRIPEPTHDPDEAASELSILLGRYGLDGLYQGAALGDACRDAAFALGIPFRQAPKDRLSEIALHASMTIARAQNRSSPPHRPPGDQRRFGGGPAAQTAEAG